MVVDPLEEQMQAMDRAWEAKANEQRHRAQRDIQLLLEGQKPAEGEDYGFWKDTMALAISAFERGGEQMVQRYLALLLRDPKRRIRRLLEKADTPDGQSWIGVLIVLWRKLQEEDRRKETEHRIRERLARSSGDEMADEIMKMLHEGDLSRTDIYRRYSRNISAERINEALFVLERLGWARWKMVSTGGRGREVWSVPPLEEDHS